MNYMIRLEIRLEIRHNGVMRVCVIKDKTAVVVVASHRSDLLLEIVGWTCLNTAS